MSAESAIDELESLAIAMRSQPGVFALLLGSGVSRGAGVLTGWEVMCDLIRQIAAMRGSDCDGDPVDWYRNAFGDNPSYSSILGELGPTATERQAILKRYFEPNAEERKQGTKQPSIAHAAIAELVAGGYVKVVVTTNFDRLIENAISQAGVEPVVLSNDGDFENARPLAHASPCVIKLHGDYLDPETLNTELELSKYGEIKRQYLGRAIEDHGLVVCGWSAEWDVALRETLESKTNGYYPTYWHIFSEVSDRAEKCIEARSSRRIRQGDANHLFATLRDRVFALEQYTAKSTRKDSLSVADFKVLLSEDRHGIRVRDFIRDLVEEVFQTASRIAPPNLINKAPRRDTVEPKLTEIERAASNLVNCAFVAGQWLEPGHVDTWHQAFNRLVHCETSPNSVSAWHSLREYPAVLALHALSAGAILSKRYGPLGSLLHLNVDQVVLVDDRIAHIPEWVHKVLDRHFTPIFALHERIFETIRDILIDADYLANQLSVAFSEAEILQVLAQAPFDPNTPTAVPLGRFMSQLHEQETKEIFAKIRESIKVLDSNSPYVTSAIFGESPDDCLQNLEDLSNRIPAIRQDQRFRRYFL